MKTIIRKDEGAVSPVIATILMVAITVVLAAVLYVMVSGLLTPTGTGPKVMGVTLSRSTDGSNWTLLITSTPSGLTTLGTKLTIISGGGTNVLNGKAFNALVYSSDRAAFVGTGGSTVVVGDRLLISTVTYPTGNSYQISDASNILANGILQG